MYPDKACTWPCGLGRKTSAFWQGRNTSSGHRKLLRAAPWRKGDNVQIRQEAGALFQLRRDEVLALSKWLRRV